MLERELESKCRADAKASGCKLIKLSPQYTPGLPDRLLIGRYGTVLVEFKAPGKTLTKLQKKFRRDTEIAGGYVYVCDNQQAFAHILTTVSTAGYHPPIRT